MEKTKLAAKLGEKEQLLFFLSQQIPKVKDRSDLPSRLWALLFSLNQGTP